MKVKKLLKHTLKDNYIRIIYKKNILFSGMASGICSKSILERKIKYIYTDDIPESMIIICVK